MIKVYETLRATILANLGIDYTVTGDLLNLCFAGNLAPDSLTSFFSKYDIELLEYQSVWLLSKLSGQLQYKGVPEEQVPRVRGVVKKFMVVNGRRLCILPAVLDALSKAGVEIMLLGGTAMKVFYEPGETRYESANEILVHTGDVKKTELILEKQGFRLKDSSLFRRAYQKNDIWLVVYTAYLRTTTLTGDMADIWRHSLPIKWQGKNDTLVPCAEMMLLILLVQALEDSCSRICDGLANQFVTRFLDIRFFLKRSSLDWNLLVELAVRSRITLHASLMLDILNHLYPGLVTEELLNAFLFTDQDVVNVQRLISYNIARKQMADAKNRHNRLGYYYSGAAALWHLNCYCGNCSSAVSNVIDFPRFISEWNGHKGIQGVLSRLGGYK